jgi:hypothetical protein
MYDIVGVWLLSSLGYTPFLLPSSIYDIQYGDGVSLGGLDA